MHGKIRRERKANEKTCLKRVSVCGQRASVSGHDEKAASHIIDDERRDNQYNIWDSIPVVAYILWLRILPTNIPSPNHHMPAISHKPVHVGRLTTSNSIPKWTLVSARHISRGRHVRNRNLRPRVLGHWESVQAIPRTVQSLVADGWARLLGQHHHHGDW
jgi:hypothetical protein